MALTFAPHLDVLPVEDRGLATIGEHGADVYSGPEFARIGSLVDGARTQSDILAQAEASEREAFTAALDHLVRAGVLIERNGKAPRLDAAWWSSQIIQPDAARETIRQTPIRVQALGGIDPDPMSEALEAGGVELSEDAALTLVLVEDYLEPGLAALNERAFEEDRRWILARPGSAKILMGPVFWPDHGPCWECLAARLRERRNLESRIRWIAKADGLLAPVPGLGGQERLGPALIAAEVQRWLAGTRPGFESMILSFDSRTWETARHQVPWRPQCRVCGAGEMSVDRGALPVRIRPSGKPDGHGGLRTVSPKTTIERLEQHVGRLTGAVDILQRAPGPAHLHAYMSGGPVPRIHGDHRGWEMLPDQLSGGKGTTDEEARASALCEALERYSGNFFGDEPRRRARLEELGDAAIPPNDYMRFSERQFEERARWNERSGSFRTFVPERFDPNLAIEWSPVWSVTHEQERYLPTALCYYGAQVWGAPFCVAESNGNAAGNTIEEAILHGILELVERDHVALWWYNRIAAPGVDLTSIDDPWLTGLREQIAGEGRELWALDLSADLGVPAAAALVASADGSGVGMGFGAHLDLTSAVVRAATELAQLGLGSPSGGLGTGVDPAVRLGDHEFMRPDPDVPLQSLDGAPRFTGDVVEALDICRAGIEGQGMELLVLDQTRPDIGLPVAKAIVPGMRHFWPRFGPGRLYDVPVALGRLQERHDEDELNQTPPVP